MTDEDESSVEHDGIVWQIDHDRGFVRYWAHVEGHGAVAAIAPQDTKRPIEDDCNALLFVKHPGEDDLQLFLALDITDAFAIGAWQVKRYQESLGDGPEP